MTTFDTPSGPFVNTELDHAPGSREYLLASLQNVAPGSDAVIARFERIRERATDLMNSIFDVCPDSMERDTAEGELLDCVMWAIKSIAFHQAEPYERKWLYEPEPALVHGDELHVYSEAQSEAQLDSGGIQGCAPNRYVDPELALKMISQSVAMHMPLEQLVEQYMSVLDRLENR